MAAEHAVIETRGLRFAYPGSLELSWPDWQADRGEVLLLRGPSGSGKSTLLALCAGLLTPGAGVLRVAGQEPARLAPSQRDRWRGQTLGFLPQRLVLSAALTVRQNLLLAGLACGRDIDPAWMTDLTTRLGLSGLLDRRPDTLSVGQAQRVALARALLQRPAVILADEPTASLDAAAAAAVTDLLLQARLWADATLVVATHDERIPARLDRSGLPWRQIALPDPEHVAAGAEA